MSETAAPNPGRGAASKRSPRSPQRQNCRQERCRDRHGSSSAHQQAATAGPTGVWTATAGSGQGSAEEEGEAVAERLVSFCKFLYTWVVRI